MSDTRTNSAAPARPIQVTFVATVDAWTSSVERGRRRPEGQQPFHAAADRRRQVLRGARPGAIDVDVIEQEDVQRGGEVAEEAVVGGGGVADLEEGKDERGEEARASRPEDQKRNAELEHQRGAALEVVPPDRKVVRRERQPGRQRRGLVVVGHRAAVLPVAELRLPLGDARLEVELEQHETKQEVNERRGAVRR